MASITSAACTVENRTSRERPVCLLSGHLSDTYQLFSSSHHKCCEVPAVLSPTTSGRNSPLRGIVSANVSHLVPGLVVTSPSAIVTREQDGQRFDNENGDLVVSVGHVLGDRYEVLFGLGSGSFGQVVLCRDGRAEQSSSSLVAVKILRSGETMDSWAQSEIDTLDCIQREREKSNASVGMKYLVKYHGRFRERGHACIVFEYLKASLFQVLEQRDYRGLPFERIRDVGRQLFGALVALHGIGLIHADVKPENVMVTESSSSKRWRVKLIDFGTSFPSNGATYHYIQSRYYRAPEVILGADYDEKIDIWSAGAVLAEMFFGIPLLPGTNEFEQLRLMETVFERGQHKEVLQRGVTSSEFYHQPRNESDFFLRRRESFYEERREEIQVQPKCFRYDTFADLIAHRPFTQEDIQTAFCAVRDGGVFQKPELVKVLSRGAKESASNLYLASSPSVTALHEEVVQSVCTESGITAEEMNHMKNYSEYQRYLLADLILLCMDLDPSRRPSATEVLQHNFFACFR